MKKIFKYFGLFLSAALIGAAAVSCVSKEDEESADLGLGIKTFFPEKVIAGTAMTINGSGFTEATAVVFPEEVVVTSFKIVTDNMIRVTAPAGIADEGGKIIVRTNDDEAVSSQTLILGKPTITGYSKQEGETITGGDKLTIYGKDLEFITSIELIDNENNILIVEDKSFYRKGTSNVVVIIPRNVYEGTFAGKIYTADGKSFALPAYTYEKPVEGHWELVKELIWQNDGSIGAVNWSSDLRFAVDGHQTGEECYIVPADIWARMKSETFYALVSGDSPQIRVVTGWWSEQWGGGDFQPGNELLTKNDDGTWVLELNLAGSDIVGTMDEKHLLFTGGGYTLQELYFQSEQWVGGGEAPVEEYDISMFTVYEAEGLRDTNIEWPFYPSWSDASGKARIMRGMGDPTIESLSLSTSSMFVVYKEVGTTGQIQWNNPNWGSFADVSCNDWDGGAETIEVPLTEDMLKCISGEISDGWGNTAFIIQGDGLKVNKIVLVP